MIAYALLYIYIQQDLVCVDIIERVLFRMNLHGVQALAIPNINMKLAGWMMVMMVDG